MQASTIAVLVEPQTSDEFCEMSDHSLRGKTAHVPQHSWPLRVVLKQDDQAVGPQLAQT